MKKDRYILWLTLVLILVVLLILIVNNKNPFNNFDLQHSFTIENTISTNEDCSYYTNDTIVVVDRNGSELKRFKINLIDSLYRIVQSQNNKYLFIGLSSFGDAMFQFLGLLDIKSKEWIIYQKLNTNSDNWKNCVLSNAHYVGTSSDNKYHLFTGGTGVVREFQIYSSKGHLIKNGRYVMGMVNNELVWADNSFFYFEKTDSFPNYLQTPKNNHGYVQKKFWIDGKDSITEEYEEIYIE